MRCLFFARAFISTGDRVASSVQRRRIGLTCLKLLSNDGTRNSILPPATDGAAGGDGSVMSEAQTSSSPSSAGSCSGGAFPPHVFSAPGDPFPFKLYGEDTRVYVNDANRVFSTSTHASYDPAAFVGEAQAQLREAAAQKSGPSSGGIYSFLHKSERESGAAAVGVTAAAVAMSADVKKPEIAVFTHPAAPKPLQTEKGPAPLRFVSTKSAKTAEEADSSESSNFPGSPDSSNSSNASNTSNASDASNASHSSDSSDASDSLGSALHSVSVRDHMRRSVSVSPLRSFALLAPRLPPFLAQRLAAAGFSLPTPVQSVAIPLFLQRHDVTCVAPTGSGKTVAFALPALAAAARTLANSHNSHNSANSHNSDNSANSHNSALASPVVLVLCPTRELAQQTFCVFSLLAGRSLRVDCLFGGEERARQKSALRARGGCDVLVSTPGRLCDFMESRAVSLRRVEFFVLDEADRMLQLGFAPQLEFIAAAMRGAERQTRQTSMWTATWSAKVGALAARFMRPARLLIEVNNSSPQRVATNANISHRFYPVADASERVAAVARLYDSGAIQKNEQVLFFVNRQSAAEALAAELVRALRAPPELVRALHGRMKQKTRAAVVRGFRDGAVRILCATDIAARGLDVPEIAHVINYELPAFTDIFVHRVGRTGRAGRAGTAHTLIVRGDKRAPQIARFAAAHCGAALPDAVLDIVRNIERSGGHTEEREGEEREREREREGKEGNGRNVRFRSHAAFAGGDWRAPAGRANASREKSSRFVRGIGRVVTLARPNKEK